MDTKNTEEIYFQTLFEKKKGMRSYSALICLLHTTTHSYCISYNNNNQKGLMTCDYEITQRCFKELTI